MVIRSDWESLGKLYCKVRGEGLNGHDAFVFFESQLYVLIVVVVEEILEMELGGVKMFKGRLQARYLWYLIR